MNIELVPGRNNECMESYLCLFDMKITQTSNQMHQLNILFAVTWNIFWFVTCISDASIYVDLFSHNK